LTVYRRLRVGGDAPTNMQKKIENELSITCRVCEARK